MSTWPTTTGEVEDHNQKEESYEDRNGDYDTRVDRVYRVLVGVTLIRFGVAGQFHGVLLIVGAASGIPRCGDTDAGEGDGHPVGRENCDAGDGREETGYGRADDGLTGSGW